MSTSRRKKVSDAIRILQRKRDASARATHLKAEIGMVPNSTIERKIMSTKTSIKRVALVAAAALTLGGFSAVSANAASAPATPFYVSAADSTSYGSGNNAATMTATAVAGAYNYVTITGSDTLSAGYLGVAVSGGSSILSVAQQPTSASAGDTITVASNGLSATTASTTPRLSGAIIKISTPVVGTITVTITKNVDTTGNVATTTLQTLTITVNAASVVGSYSAANSFATRIDTATTNPNAIAQLETATVTSSTADSTAAVSKGTVGSPAAVSVIAVRLRDTQAVPAAIAGASVVASISGTGLLKGTGALTDTPTPGTFSQTAGPVSSSTTDNNGWAWFQVLNAGAAGVGTITVTYNDGTTNWTVATKTITFYGAVAAIKATQGKYIVASSGSATGGTTSTTYAVQLTATDSSGNPVDVTGLTFTGTSDNTVGIATTTYYVSAGLCAGDAVNTLALDCAVTGATSGTAGSAANVTFSYTDASTVKYSTAAVPFTIGGTTVSSVALTFDKASYNVGDLVTATLTLKDSKGNAVADKTYSLFDTTTSTTVFASSAQLTTAPFGSRYVTTSKGVATATFYAPFTTGNLNLSATIGGTSGTAWNDAASTLAATTVAGVAVVSASSISGDSSLALDAANAATDAANNAYDEAQNATQAASDALAAVKALAVQVKALIALVTKIKNKVGA